MSNQFFVPFNNDPSAISVQTSTYTIPSGKYAYVIPDILSSDFTIDGTSPIDDIEIDASNGNLSGSGSTVFTCPADRVAVVTVGARSGTATVTDVYLRSNGSASIQAKLFSVAASGGATGFSNSVIMSGGDTIFADPNTASGHSCFVTGHYIANGSIPNGFWVPSGTDLDGSRYTVIEYNKIS